MAGREPMNALDIVGHAGLVQAVVQQTHQCLIPGLVDRDDLVQDAWEGVIRGAQSFDPERATVLSSWLWRYSKGRILDQSRKMTKSRTYGAGVVFKSLDAPVNESDESEKTYQPSVTDESDIALVDLSDMLSILTPQERRVVEWCYVECKDQSELSKEWGLSKSRISQIGSKALEKLRAHIQPQATAA